MNLKVKTLTTILSVILLQGSLGETHNLSMDFGGWSHHFYDLNKQTSKHISYNQSHNLFGLRYGYNNPSNVFEYSAGANFMIDSFGAKAYTLALGAHANAYKYKEFYVDIGGIVAAQNRSWIHSVSRNGVKFERLTVPFVAPELKIGYGRLYVSSMLVPNVKTVNGKVKLANPTIFMQFGIKLS